MLNIIYALFAVISIPCSILAQTPPYTPTTTSLAGSSYIENKIFYINGGAIAANLSLGVYNTIRQTFSVDLSKSWNVDSPVYNLLILGPNPSGAILSSALSPDNQAWFIISNGGSSVYNISTSEWIKGPDNTLFSQNPGFGTATDPASGTIFVPCSIGLPTVAGSNVLVSLHVTAGTIDNVGQHAFQGVFNGFNVAWSAALKVVLIYGGLLPGGVPRATDAVVTFKPADGTWGSIALRSATNNLPAGREKPCFLPWNGGSKMVLFGGLVRVGQFATLGDLYILDLATNIWTQGVSAPATEGRQGASCAISNDQLIVWGGWDEQYSIKKNAMLVYDLKANAWQSKYVAHSAPTTTTTSASGPNSPKESMTSPPGVSETTTPTKVKPNIGVIVGPIVGLLLIIITGVLLVLRVRRKRRLLAEGKTYENEKEDKNKVNGEKDSYGFGYGNGSEDSDSAGDLSSSKKDLFHKMMNAKDLSSLRAPTYPAKARGATDVYSAGKPYPVIIPTNINQDSGLEYNPSSRQNSKRGNVQDGEYGSRHSQYPPVNNNNNYNNTTRQNSRRNLQEGDNGAMNYSYYSQHPQEYQNMEGDHVNLKPRQFSRRRNLQEGEFGANRFSQHPHTEVEIPMEMPSRRIHSSRTQRSAQRGPRNPQTSHEGSVNSFYDGQDRSPNHPQQQQQQQMISQRSAKPPESPRSRSTVTTGPTTDILDAYFLPSASPPLPPLPTSQF